MLNYEFQIDEEDKYKLEQGLALTDDLITDEAKRNQAKDIIRKCYDKSNEHFITYISYYFLIILLFYSHINIILYYTCFL